MKFALIVALAWSFMYQCCEGQLSGSSVRLTKEEQHDQAISLAIGHLAVLASWRTGDVSIVEDDFLDQGNSEHVGQYREGRISHRLIFDRDQDKYYYCAQSNYRTGVVTKEGQLETDDWSELSVTLIDSEAEVATVCSYGAASTPLTTRPIESAEAALDEYKVPTIWGIGVRTLHLPSARLLKTYESRVLASLAGTYRLRADGSEFFSLTYPHATGSATRTTRLSLKNGFPESDTLTAVGKINGQKIRATGETNDYQWEKDASGNWRPAAVVVMKPRNVVQEGKAYRYMQTRLFKFHWHGLNEPLSEEVFDKAKVADLGYINSLLDIPTEGP